jgi:hypothetical protein
MSKAVILLLCTLRVGPFDELVFPAPATIVQEGCHGH